MNNAAEATTTQNDTAESSEAQSLIPLRLKATKHPKLTTTHWQKAILVTSAAENHDDSMEKWSISAVDPMMGDV